MNIAQSCFSDSWGGLEMVPLKWSRYLQQKNKFGIFFCKKNSPLQTQLAAMSLNYVSLSFWNKYWTYGISKKIKNICHSENIDVIISHRSSDLWHITPIIKPNSKPRLIFVNHILSSTAYKRDWLHRKIYEKVDTVIVLSELAKTYFIKTTGVDANKIHIIPNGIEIDKFRSSSSARTRMRQKLKIKENEKVILLVGRIDPGKGQLEFIQALPGVVRQFPAVKTIIVGEPTRGEGDNYSRKLTQTIAKLELEHKVLFSGFQENVAPFYSAADMLVMPSYFETFGLVLLEAMASRLPVIATNTGAPPDILDNGRYGLLIPPQNARAISDALIEYLSNPTKMADFGEKGYKRVQQKYQLSIVMEQILELCDRLITENVTQASGL